MRVGYTCVLEPDESSPGDAIVSIVPLRSHQNKHGILARVDASIVYAGIGSFTPHHCLAQPRTDEHECLREQARQESGAKAQFLSLALPFIRMTFNAMFAASLDFILFAPLASLDLYASKGGGYALRIEDIDRLSVYRSLLSCYPDSPFIGHAEA